VQYFHGWTPKRGHYAHGRKTIPWNDARELREIRTYCSKYGVNSVLMQPLDDFYYFAKVIEHGGYAKASRALDIPKSRLSRHVAALDSRLGVRMPPSPLRRRRIVKRGSCSMPTGLLCKSNTRRGWCATTSRCCDPRCSPGSVLRCFPKSAVRADVDSGKLEQVLPAWTLPLGVFHLVFPTRRGLLPSVRAFIDFLAERMPRLI
jgi:hypothetical protein